MNAYQASIGNQSYAVLPDWQMAMRDDDYKLVSYQKTDYFSASNSCVSTPYTQFYEINQATGVNLKLDNKGATCTQTNWTRTQKKRSTNYPRNSISCSTRRLTAPAMAISTAWSIKRISSS